MTITLAEAPVITYVGLHARLARVRGKARDHTCVECGAPADDWSYDHRDPDEVVGEHHGCMVAYSLDLARYQPMCRSCHVYRDREHWSTCLRSGCTVYARHDYCWAHAPGAARRSGRELGYVEAVDDAGRARPAPVDRPAGLITSKVCGSCAVEKPVASFSTRGRDARGRRDPFKSICLDCDRERARARYRSRRAAA